MYITSSLSIILSVDPQVASISWLLWIVWLWTQACIFWIIVLSGFKSRSRTTGSYGSSIFSFLRNCSTVFHSGFTSFHPQQQRTLHGDMLLFLSSSLAHWQSLRARVLFLYLAAQGVAVSAGTGDSFVTLLAYQWVTLSGCLLSLAWPCMVCVRLGISEQAALPWCVHRSIWGTSLPSFS